MMAESYDICAIDEIMDGGVDGDCIRAATCLQRRQRRASRMHISLCVQEYLPSVV